MDLHYRMRVARLAAGLSQSQVARLLHVTPHTVYRYERQALTPSLSQLARLARELGVSIDWLVTGDGKGPEPRMHAPHPARDIAPATGATRGADTTAQAHR